VLGFQLFDVLVHTTQRRLATRIIPARTCCVHQGQYGHDAQTVLYY